MGYRHIFRPACDLSNILAGITKDDMYFPETGGVYQMPLWQD